MLMHWIPCPGQGDRLGRPLPGISCFANIYHNYSCRLQVSCTPRLPLHSSLLTHIHASAGHSYGQLSSAALASPIRCPLVHTHSSRSAGLEASSSSTVQSGSLHPGNGSSPNGRTPMGSGDDDFAVNFGGKQLWPCAYDSIVCCCCRIRQQCGDIYACQCCACPCWRCVVTMHP